MDNIEIDLKEIVTPINIDFNNAVTTIKIQPKVENEILVYKEDVEVDEGVLEL